MKNTMELSKLKNTYLLLLISVFILSSCAGPKIAVDLLANAKANEKPLTNNSSLVNVKINPDINNYEKIDESVKESLEIALTNANIFAASQSPMSFGSFEGKLEIHYIVFDPNDEEILDKTIYTEAGSDKWSFSGAKRSRRARAVNISENVLQFVDILQNLLNK